MNKEEIPVFSWNTKTKEFYVLGHKFDGVNSIEDFINYITNLDKENKQLKDNWNKLKEWLSEQPIFDYLSPADIKAKIQELEKGDSNE